MENNTNEKSPLEILETPLYINWFGVYINGYGFVERPKQENSCFYPDFDQDIANDQIYWDREKKAVMFPDFFVDEQVDIVTFLRNDKLDITLTVLNFENERELVFVEAKNIGELFNKYPVLTHYLTEKICKNLSMPYYHPLNDIN